MIDKIIKAFKTLNKVTHKILTNGLKFCFGLSILSCIILILYLFCFKSPNIFYIGFSLFKLSIVFSVEFIVCGFSVDLIKKQIT